MKRVLSLFALLGLLCAGLRVDAQPVAEAPVLTLEGVEILAAAAQAEAVANDWNVVIVIVDAGGNLLHLQRMDGVQLGSLEIAQRKARTAAFYRRPTQIFADRLASGNAATQTLPDVIPLRGGLPIAVNGTVVGAIGVSGVQSIQDEQIAQAGITALLRRING